MQANVTREQFQAFIEKILPEVHNLTPNQQHALYVSLTKLRELEKLEDARNHIIPFMQLCWGDAFVTSWHHHTIAALLEQMERGEILRACISTPPRYTKSQMLSIYYPAWILGRDPSEKTKIIQAGNTQRLSERFGRQCKNVIQSPEFAELFPKAKLRSDSKAGGNFTLQDGAEYYAAGIGGALAGRGALYLLCDDVFSEQDVLSGNSADLFENAESWYLTALQRQQPGGRAVVLHTRWSKLDLIGRLEDRMKKKGAEQYKIISIPALDENDESTFPGYWKTPMLQQMRTTLCEKTPHLWYAQYQQSPTSDGMSIIKRDWWKKWEKRNSAGEFVTPPCSFTLMVFDTAYTANKRSNPSACTVWGIFSEEDKEGRIENNIILLGSTQKKMELPELKTFAKDLYRKWEPDAVLVEGKSSGPWLLVEFRDSGIPAQAVMPKPNEDKMSRLNSVADIFASGRVYYIPTTENEETVQQCADFPSGAGDDLVDTTAYALRRFRQGGFVATKHDVRDDLDQKPLVVERDYY